MNEQKIAVCHIDCYDFDTGICRDANSDIDREVQCKDFPRCTMRLDVHS